MTTGGGAAAVDLVGVGLNATDTLIPLATFPERGSKVEYRDSSVLPGGQVATAVIACQRWGLRTRYVGALGEDEAAAMHRREFAAAGVETQIVTLPGAPSAQSLILVDSADGSGERTVLRRGSDGMVLRPEHLRRGWITDARALLVDGYDTAAATLAAGWARSAGVLVVADLDEVYPGVEDLLLQVDYAIVSRDLPQRLTGEADLRRALRTMQRRFGCRLAAATLGEGGVLGWDGELWYQEAAFEVPVADTTGAGDVFHAGFCYGLLAGWELPRVLRFSCAAAALNCTAPGARGGIAPLARIKELARSGSRHPITAARQ